ncbi:MAG: hypothetical protein JST40_10235 [Armatimonadetes bacterium]|nr:hypothetical protein [Armatimonadota bacterium]
MILCAAWMAAAVSARYGAWAKPIRTEWEFGTSLAAKRQPESTVFREDRVVIGRWFNGKSKLAVEHALWLNPRFVSRWLGYWERREHWPAEESARRFDTFRSGMPGNQWFLISLSAYPKYPMLELVDSVDARPGDLELQSAEIGSQVGALRELNRIQTRNREDIEKHEWWLGAPELGPLVPKHHQGPQPSPYQLGDYFGRWYLVKVSSCPLTSFEVVLRGPAKDRVARFANGR